MQFGIQRGRESNQKIKGMNAIAEYAFGILHDSPPTEEVALR